jgi:hypothetical protein
MKKADLLKLIDQSIAHWEENAKVNPDTFSTGAEDCALCGYFRFRPDKTMCKGCPIEAQTKQPYCRDTPYSSIVNFVEHDKFDWTNQDDLDSLKAFCVLELTFLRKVRQGAEDRPDE